uniref:GntR family transcriptional regulator n=1 Tax=Streptomyces sp. CA-141956 TaxID=3240051 RepID=UPI003F49288D
MAAAMAQLDELGEVLYTGRNCVPRRLGPTEQHPDGVKLAQTVRARVRNGVYRPGTPLPTAILAVRHGLDVKKVPRALRLLIRDQLVAYRQGPAGPG